MFPDALKGECRLPVSLVCRRSKRLSTHGDRTAVRFPATVIAAQVLKKQSRVQCADGDGVLDGCFDWSSAAFGGFIFFN